MADHQDDSARPVRRSTALPPFVGPRPTPAPLTQRPSAPFQPRTSRVFTPPGQQRVEGPPRQSTPMTRPIRPTPAPTPYVPDPHAGTRLPTPRALEPIAPPAPPAPLASPSYAMPPVSPPPEGDDFVIVREEQSIDLPLLGENDTPQREPSGNYQAIDYRDASYHLAAQSLPGQRPTLDGLEIETTDISFGEEGSAPAASGLELWGASPSDELYGSMDAETPSAMSDALAEIDSLVAERQEAALPDVPASPWDMLDPFAAAAPAAPAAPVWESPTAIPASPAPAGTADAASIPPTPWRTPAEPDASPERALAASPVAWRDPADSTAYAPTDPSLVPIEEMVTEVVEQPAEALAYEPLPASQPRVRQTIIPVFLSS